jgi:hypothetical protein
MSNHRRTAGFVREFSAKEQSLLQGRAAETWAVAMICWLGREVVMVSVGREKGILLLLAMAALILGEPRSATAQSAGGGAATRDNPAQMNIAAVGSLLQQLQTQVQDLSAQVKSLKEQQQESLAESGELRRELEFTRTQLVSLITKASGTAAQSASQEASPQRAIEDRVEKLEENQQMTGAQAAEQSQTKVESYSKYRLRLSGIVLLNTYVNRGSVNNQDFPAIATAPGPLASDGTFGGSLRQSQIGLEAFGPTIAGARTSASIQFDFSGGIPNAPNGASFGIMRLRTGTVRFDWENTSIIAGQDSLFLAPLSPTSIATLAAPGFAYSGNLWSWAPQVRVEHRFTLSENSKLLLEGGVLDSLTGDVPVAGYNRYQTAGENSGQPAYATRLAWTRSVDGRDIILGVGGYYGRQNYGFGRTIDGWAGTMDLTLPLGRRFALTGQFYRGRAIGGLGGGIGQSVLWMGSLVDPETEVYALDSLGGWAQLKFKATSKLEFNGAFGQDNPYAGQMREFGSNQTYYYTSPLSKNQSAMANFLYQPKSDIVFSLEYRRLKTYTLDSNANGANIITMSAGYLF